MATRPMDYLGRVDICKVIYNRRGEVPSPDRVADPTPTHSTDGQTVFLTHVEPSHNGDVLFLISPRGAIGV